jgi:hypothetical protein
MLGIILEPNKRSLFAQIFLFAFTYHFLYQPLSCNALEPQPKKAAPHIKIEFDRRKWKLGYEKSDNAGNYIKEYVLPPETVENWTELVTENFYPDMAKSMNCDQFMQSFLTSLGQTTQKAKFRVLKESPQECIFEWIVEGDPKQDNQHELDRILLSGKNIFFLHYVIKNPKKNFNEQKRKQWLKHLQNAKVLN